MITDLARALDTAENAINSALGKRGDTNWRWHGSLANPHTVPVIWNDIEVTETGGIARILPAIDYIKEA